MRRMLTEKDVDKIDSIDPADIETLKATGSPKGATSGYVLTADGNGKATYKYKSSGTVIDYSLYQPISVTGYQTDNDGNKFISMYADCGSHEHVMYLWIRDSLKADGVAIPRAEYTLTSNQNYMGGNDKILIYLPDETIAKHSITAQTKFTGSVAFFYKWDSRDH